METINQVKPEEQQRSFDVLASVNQFRHDLDNFGYVLPETRDQVVDEQLSYLAEGVDRAVKTTFVLRREGDELIYFSKGEWTSYNAMLTGSLEVASQESDKDQRRQFLTDRATTDLINGWKMQELKPGERMSWFSEFPREEANRYGEKFIASAGFLPHREMAFIYQARCREDGHVVLESQTIDRSDNDGLKAIQNEINTNPDADIATLTASYDSALFKKHGERFYAGRTEEENRADVWEQITSQTDLTGYLVNELEKIAGLNIDRNQAEELTKKSIYGVWALFKKRLDGKASSYADSLNYLSNEQVYAQVALDARQAFGEFASAGKMLIGCGGNIMMLRNQSDVMSANPEDIFNAIFGSNTEKYSFNKKMFCVVCQAPPKEKDEPKKKCGPCGICKTCDKKLKKAGDN